MDKLSLGVVGTSRKPDEHRLPIHPGHLGRIDAELRRRMFLEHGYGQRFGVSDEELAKQVGGLRSREQLLEECDVVLIPKPLAADLAALRPGRVLWGWPHCVQDEELTQVAIDRHLTLIAWEAMNHWTPDGNFSLHVFHKNNELAGYCSVLHALALIGATGAYGRRLSAAVISFGATARGAVVALFALGVHDVNVLTHRSVPAVAAPIAPARLVHYEHDPSIRAGCSRCSPTATGRSPSSSPNTTSSSIVRCRTPTHPQMFVTRDELELFTPGSAVRRRLLRRGHGLRVGAPDVVRGSDLQRRPGRAVLRRRSQPVLLVELFDVGDQRGVVAVSRDRDVRPRGLGGRPDDPASDRDPRRRDSEPEDSLVPVPLAGVPPRQGMNERSVAGDHGLDQRDPLLGDVAGQALHPCLIVGHQHVQAQRRLRRPWRERCRRGGD